MALAPPNGEFVCLRIGIKAKQNYAAAGFFVLVCLPKNWNQGKAQAAVMVTDPEFVCLRIGIKAKLQNTRQCCRFEFVCLRIGIKAKLEAGRTLKTMSLSA